MCAYIVLLTGLTRHAWAQDGSNIEVHSSAYGDLQIDPSTGQLWATASGGVWIEDLHPVNEIICEAYLIDNNNVLNYELFIWEAPSMGSYDVFSRDPNNPDVLPLAWEHQLTPGVHTVRFYCILYVIGGTFADDYVALYDVQQQVTVP